MKVGICWPMTMDTARQRDLFFKWCERADETPLSSINVGDRIAYDSQEPLISLAVAAGITKRIKLMTSVVALPMRNTGLFAKQVASLDLLSGGRFALGVGMSSRPDDFAALGVPWEDRAQQFEKQIGELREIWSGKSLVDGVAPIGPTPVTDGGPRIIVGAISEAALRRAGRIADGIMTWSFKPEPDVQRAQIRITEESWREAGRPGRPEITAAMYFCLGDNAEDRLFSYLRHYYDYSELTRDRALLAQTCTPEQIKRAIQSYADAGVDEILFSAADASVDQIDRLVELLP